MLLARAISKIDVSPSHRRVFVPTMGALHEGHAALVRRARVLAGSSGRVVVSVFVNPTQFNDPGDLQRYPRTLDADAELCRQAGADVVYAPAVEEIYPQGPDAADPRSSRLPAVATEPGLEDAHRPGHFSGVYRVVGRLFDLVHPSAAIFGEKDWQQLQVVRALVRDESMPIEIVPAPTVREPDGLAMSSRNRFLTAADRPAALSLSAALRAAAAEPTPAQAEAAMARVLSAGGAAVEYAVVRDAGTLAAPGASAVAGRPLRAIIAARVGSVRLIDNAPWAWPTGR